MRSPPAGRDYGQLLDAMNVMLTELSSDGGEQEALSASFAASARGFGAEKALLLSVEQTDPLRLRAICTTGKLSPGQVRACERGESVPGVSGAPGLARVAGRGLAIKRLATACPSECSWNRTRGAGASGFAIVAANRDCGVAATGVAGTVRSNDCADSCADGAARTSDPGQVAAFQPAKSLSVQSQLLGSHLSSPRGAAHPLANVQTGGWPRLPILCCQRQQLQSLRSVIARHAPRLAGRATDRHERSMSGALAADERSPPLPGSPTAPVPAST
jgi:hypothetical protein